MILDTRVVERKASPSIEDRRGKKKGEGRKKKEEKGKRNEERGKMKKAGERGRRKRRRWLARSAGICITKRAIIKFPVWRATTKEHFVLSLCSCNLPSPSSLSRRPFPLFVFTPSPKRKSHGWGQNVGWRSQRGSWKQADT